MRRFLLSVLLIALVPFGVAVWKVWSDDAEQSYQQVVSARHETRIAVIDPDSLETQVAHYLANRNPAVDQSLPQGHGGTHFYRDLDGNAGMTFPAHAAIGIAVLDELTDAESTEIHERAHLLHVFQRPLVDKLLARVRHPQADEYAAKSPDEHFSEMASEAWDVVVPPSDVCRVLSAAELLEDAEQRVPGTSGFVVWFLRNPQLRKIPGNDEALALAQKLSAPDHEQWNAIYASLEERRNSDGTFDEWPTMSFPKAFMALMHRLF